MGFLDRFKRKKEPATAPEAPAGPGSAPEPDTAAVILLGEDAGWAAVTKAVEERFGAQALVSTDNSAPNAPAMTIRLEGVEFFCSYLAMPHPAEVYDLSSLQEGLFSPQEREELLSHRAFLVLAQKGGGTSLAEKRRVCRLFTRLAGALAGLDGAAGVFLTSAELLISRRVYLYHAAILEKNWEDPEYFPVPPVDQHPQRPEGGGPYGGHLGSETIRFSGAVVPGRQIPLAGAPREAVSYVHVPDHRAGALSGYGHHRVYTGESVGVQGAEGRAVHCGRRRLTGLKNKPARGAGLFFTPPQGPAPGRISQKSAR